MAEYTSSSAQIHIGDMQTNFIAREHIFTEASHWEQPMHFHNGYEFHYLHKGKVGITLQDETRVILHPGEACIIPPGLSHHVGQYSDSVCHYATGFSLTHRANDSQHRFSEYAYYRGMFETHKTIEVFDGTKLFPYIEKLNDMYSQISYATLHMLEINLSMFFLEMSTLYCHNLRIQRIASQTDPHTTERKASTDGNRRWIIESYIAHNYMRERQLEELAALMHLSPAQAVRTIKKLMGCTLTEVVTRQRMEVAKMLIQSSTLPLKQIATQVGYTAYNGFFVAVKHYFGMTPEEIRKGYPTDTPISQINS